jgi:hypothetical protein
VPSERCHLCKGKGRVSWAVATGVFEADVREWFEDPDSRPCCEGWPEPVTVERVALLGTEAEVEGARWWGAKECLVFHVRTVDGTEYDFTYVPETVGCSGAPTVCAERAHRLTDWPETPEQPDPADRVHQGPRERCGCDLVHVWDEERLVGMWGDVYHQTVYSIGDHVACEHGLFARSVVQDGRLEPVVPHAHLSADYREIGGKTAIKHVGAIWNERTGLQVDGVDLDEMSPYR